MKGNHIYTRLDNYQVVRIYSNMLRNEPLDVATELFDNITREAHDHPKYVALKEIYDNRINAGQ